MEIGFVLGLRNDPAEDVLDRPWARLAGINFGRLAMQHGVIVLNDPNGLTHAVNKMYLQYFPKEVRPRTLISRDKNEIKAFIDEEGGRGVLKPITGSGGRNVFLGGLDIIGDKLMEINVFSPGGLMSVEQMEERNFCREIVLSLERKVDYLRNNPGGFDNVGLATL